MDKMRNENHEINCELAVIGAAMARTTLMFL